MAIVRNSIKFSSGGGSDIIVVANYSALPDPTTVSGQFYWVTSATTGHPAGLYYSNGVSWEVSSADDITVVANYSALPAPGTVTGEFYWCSASQGTAWLPGSLGGTYYSAGLYYSNGVSWEFMDVPYQATQAEVNTGTNTDKFVTPATLTNWTGLGNYVPYTGATATVDLGTRKILVGDGSAAAPSIGISSSTTSGFWKNSTYSALNWGSGGTFGGLFEASGLYVKSTGVISFLSSDLESASGDAILRRVGSQIIGMGTANNSSAQTFRIFGDNLNNKYLNLTHDATNAEITTNTGLVNITSLGIKPGAIMQLGSDAVGDIYYAGASNALTRLASVSAGSYLRSGGVTTAPLWSTLKLPNTATANYIPYATSANTIGESSLLKFDGTTFTGGGILTSAKTAGTYINQSASENTGTGNNRFALVLANETGAGGGVNTYAGAIGFHYLGTVGAIPSSIFGALIESGAGQTNTYFAWFTRTSTSAVQPTEKWRMSAAGNFSNTGATGTAYLHLKAGTASASTAPLKFTPSGAVLLSTAESGAVETDANGTLYSTETSLQRKALVGCVFTQTTSVTVANTVTETSIITDILSNLRSPALHNLSSVVTSAPLPT